jgi:hypothetical protein
MSRVRVAIVACAVFAAGMLVASLVPASAVGPGPVYRWFTGSIFIESGTSVNVGAYNGTSKTQNVTYRMKSTNGTTLFSGSFNVSAGQAAGQSQTVATGFVVLELDTNSDSVLPRGSFTPDGGGDEVELTAGDWYVIGPNGGTNGALVQLTKKVNTLNAKLNKALKKLDTILSKV